MRQGRGGRIGEAGALLPGLCGWGYEVGSVRQGWGGRMGEEDMGGRGRGGKALEAGG